MLLMGFLLLTSASSGANKRSRPLVLVHSFEKQETKMGENHLRSSHRTYKANKFAQLKGLWKANKTLKKDHKWSTNQALLFGLSVIGGLGLLVVTFGLGLGTGSTILFLGGIMVTLLLFLLAIRAIFKPTKNVKQGMIAGLLGLVAAAALFFGVVLRDFDPF